MESSRTVSPALASKPASRETPLGLYLHIPFCRKRCHFCYFRVYTDKNASEVQAYLDVLGREWELYADQPAVAGRSLNFVYFGGGTPSFSVGAPARGAREAAHECHAVVVSRRGHLRM